MTFCSLPKLRDLTGIKEDLINPQHVKVPLNPLRTSLYALWFGLLQAKYGCEAVGFDCATYDLCLS